MTDYLYPRSITEAVDLLADHGGRARIIAGGTDLLPELQQGKLNPRALIDITRIPECQQIDIGEAYIKIGAGVTFTRLKEEDYFQQYIPAVVDAARAVGAGAIQRAATWAGNLVQAMPAADGAILALALEAEVHLQDENSERWIPVEEIFIGPGISAVDPREQLITRIRFPTIDAGHRCGTAWKRVGRRQALVLPILNCAVKIQLTDHQDQPRIKEARIALGPAAPCPFLARETALHLKGKLPSSGTFLAAADFVQQEVQPRTSPLRASREYRQSLSHVLVAEALEEAVRRAKRVQ